jgi:membrane-associated phospholipid phosphatase
VLDRVIEASAAAASGTSSAASDSLGAVWRTYGLWAFWVGVAFFGVYPACNWWTAQRAHRFGLYLAAELDVPFIPELVWLYLSMYALFVSPPLFLSVSALRVLGRQIVAGTVAAGAIFLLVPTQLGFPRVTPENPFYAAIFAGIFSVDLPHNMLPSLHVVYSALILLALLDACARSRPWRMLFRVWLVAICASTVFVHQHHLADVLASLLIVWAVRHPVAGLTEGSAHA